jgi:hypothetical protein
LDVVPACVGADTWIKKFIGKTKGSMPSYPIFPSLLLTLQTRLIAMDLVATGRAPAGGGLEWWGR